MIFNIQSNKVSIWKLIPIIIERGFYLLGSVLRYHYYRMAFMRIGRNVHISRNVSFGGIYNIEIGDNVAINQGCNLYGDFGIKIGNNTKLSPYVQIYSANYRTESGHPLGSMGVIGKKIEIGDNVWVGAGSIILSGVTIGDGCILGAGSVVCKDIPYNQIWAGNPARMIRSK